MIADEIYRDEPRRAPLVMASATTLGMPCDDSRYMDAVARRVRFEGIRWNALEPNLADIEDPILAHPGMRRGIGGGPGAICGSRGTEAPACCFTDSSATR